MTVSENAVHYLEIVTPDVKAMCRLYSEAYGWNFQAKGPELGHAFVAEIPGGSLCGIRAPMRETETPIVRTYLRVANIESAAREAARLGAQIALEPVEIAGYGRIAIYQCGGIDQGIWQVL